MSAKYDEYLQEHKQAVREAFKWLSERNIIPTDVLNDVSHACEFAHDESKTDQEEYDAYDQHFYGNRSYENEKSFLYAWNHHLHKNPHHWQHWILINDDKDNGEKILEIPEKYIWEMICDWWSFSHMSGNLYEIFDWYEKGKDYRKINPVSLQYIEAILETIKNNLDSEK